jgi:hypothetical protein
VIGTDATAMVIVLGYKNIAYMLLGMSQQERLAYLPTYWTALVKSALLNHAACGLISIQRSYLSQKHSLLPPCVIGTDATAMVIVGGPMT